MKVQKDTVKTSVKEKMACSINSKRKKSDGRECILY